MLKYAFFIVNKMFSTIFADQFSFAQPQYQIPFCLCYPSKIVTLTFKFTDYVVLSKNFFEPHISQPDDYRS